MTNAPPSRNPATDGTLVGLLDLFKTKLHQNFNDMLPAKVISFDRTTNRARVQLLIVKVSTDSIELPPLQVASVPVFQAGAGGFVISFPVNTGDLGWLKAADTDISLFLSSYSQAAPNTEITHDFSSSVFIPDSFMSNVTINSEDNANLVIQTNDGTVRVAIWPDKVKITAPSVVLDTATTTCTGNLVVDGTIDSTGNVTAHANLSVTGTSTVGGISFSAHRHGGVQTGGGNTGTPI